MRLPETWVEARLGDLLTRVDTKVNPQTSQSGSHFYVGLEHIESHTGRLLREAEEVTGNSDILSIKTAFKAGDILYGKLRPNLNKVLLADQDGICSTDIWALKTSEAVMPDFALRYLRSPAVYVRAAQLAAGANLPRLSAEAFDRLPIPLPTLPEQERIVDVLRQAEAEAVAKAKQSVSYLVDHLVRTAYWEYFAAWYSADGPVDPVRISDCVADSQYGISEAMEERGSHAVLRMNSITTSGWLDLSDLKYASLSEKDIESTRLQDGDLLFNRTNSKELVGKCAIWRPVTGEFSFASYLVRLRLKKEMLPEYLWATLNSAYGKYRLSNSAKQAVSMANVSPTDLGRITVPLPPLPLQEEFAAFVRSTEELRAQIHGKLQAFTELQAIVSQRALTGSLTAEWRADHATEIAEAARVRDAMLRERGAKFSLSANAVTNAPAQADLTARPARHWLLGELSEFQRQVAAAFTEYCQQSGQALLVENPEVFGRFCDDAAVTERLQALGAPHGNRIRRSLSQLAALGLIAKIALPKRAPESGELDYLKAFRPLRPDEFTRLGDVQALRKAHATGVDPQRRYYFSAQLDYENSENVGAGGMFQVISVEDDDGKDFTHLVDQGRHYASLEDLKEGLARALEVDVQQVELEEE